MIRQVVDLKLLSLHLSNVTLWFLLFTEIFTENVIILYSLRILFGMQVLVMYSNLTCTLDDVPTFFFIENIIVS